MTKENKPAKKDEPRVIIEVKDLVKTYKGGVKAVKGVSFKVYEGEIFGLLGPNGAGKTTTLEILETLRKKSSGEAFIDGLDIDHDAEKIKSIIGVQLQSAGFYPELTLYQILDIFAALYNVDIDKKDLLDKVNLYSKRKAKVVNLSGGQKQRFSIATTLVNKPKIIFLDEPTTGLDPQARRNLWKLIKEIKKQGTTVVLTTHYMDEAEELCDWIAIMNDGEIAKVDSPEKLIQGLLDKGFKRKEILKLATLEDVFLDLTGEEFRD